MHIVRYHHTIPKDIKSERQRYIYKNKIDLQLDSQTINE